MENKGARQVTEWWGPHAEREAGRAVGGRSWMGRVEKKRLRRYLSLFYIFSDFFFFPILNLNLNSILVANLYSNFECMV
jgi:hypothetical protein